jgi:predicted nucleic acid-binding protein
VTFVETGAWYSAYVVSDVNNARVQPLIDGSTARLVTTDFVLAESLNLLRARNEYPRATALGKDLLASGVAELVSVSASDLHQAFVLFATYKDKRWSFTDCTSFVVMRRLGINVAVALDRHFREMPGIAVVPDHV